MNFSITISVFPKVQHRDGHTVEGVPEIITFDEEQVIEILRKSSKIPLDQQRHWQFQSVKFD